MLKRKNKSANTSGSKDSWLLRIVQGRLVSGAFFSRHWAKIFIVLLMTLVYITNRYSSQREMEQIRTLSNRLAVVQSESVRIRGEYMGMIRESAMIEMVRSKGLDLSIRNQPPYHISY